MNHKKTGLNSAVFRHHILKPILSGLVAIFAILSGFSVSADTVIRIMAANTTSGNGQSYDPGEGNRIFQGLDPDIALVQEFNYLNKTPADIRAWVDENFGSTFSYVRGTTGSIPNGIISRYPILSSGSWNDTTLTDREFAWAKIDIPGDIDLWAVSVHLKASSADSAQRNSQASQLIAYINANIPAADYLVLGGDFNTYSRTEACVTTLAGSFVTSSPWPADSAGDGDTNAGRNEPYDWVIADTELNARKTPLVIGSRTFTNGLVFDSRIYTPLAEVAPVLVTDSGATNMQHMAVMRAFLIPVNAAPVIASAANSSSTETVTDSDLSVYEIVRGTSVELSVAATDDGGESALKYTWSKTTGTGGTVAFSVNGTNAAKNCTATFQSVGNYTLSVNVQDLPGLTIASVIKVRVVQAATRLNLTPATVSLPVNASQTFTASLSDQFNQAMTGTYSWSTTGGGTLNSNGIFIATTAGGPFIVTASGGGFSNTSSVTVTRAVAAVNLTNLNQTYDGFPKSVTATTSPAGRSVSILYSGSTTPPTAAGSYAITATITDPNYQGTASGTLAVAADSWALWKNTYFTALEQSAGMALDAGDPDSDLIQNLAEYALGTHPRQFTPPLKGVIDAGGFSLTFTRPANLPGVHYNAEISGNLSTWQVLPLEVLSTGAVETVRAREAFGATPSTPRFLRLRFERY